MRHFLSCASTFTEAGSTVEVGQKTTTRDLIAMTTTAAASRERALDSYACKTGNYYYQPLLR